MGSIRVNLNNKFKRKVKDEFYKSFFSDHGILVKCTFFFYKFLKNIINKIMSCIQFKFYYFVLKFHSFIQHTRSRCFIHWSHFIISCPIFCILITFLDNLISFV